MPATLPYATATPHGWQPRAAALVALYPLALLAALYASAAATRLALGYWPRHPVDAPAIPPLHSLEMLLLLGTPLAISASIALAVRPLLDRPDASPVRWRWLGWGVALPTAAWSLAAASAVHDPGHVWTWFMD